MIYCPICRTLPNRSPDPAPIRYGLCECNRLALFFEPSKHKPPRAADFEFFPEAQGRRSAILTQEGDLLLNNAQIPKEGALESVSTFILEAKALATLSA